MCVASPSAIGAASVELLLIGMTFFTGARQRLGYRERHVRSPPYSRLIVAGAPSDLCRRESTTTSLSESIWNYRREHGRTYHGESVLE